MGKIQCSSPDSFRLMMEGSAALTDVEQRGFRIDVAYLDRMIKESGDRIREMENSIRESEFYEVWRRRFGSAAKLSSRQQLAAVLFEELGLESRDRTKTGRPKTDIKSLDELDHPLVRKLMNLEKLKKARGTYLLGIRRETSQDGFLHMVFNLHLVDTFRSSCSDPNLQNQPKRDKRQARLVRRAFIPRNGHVLVESDYGALEFRGAACFWKDPEMIAYASDPKKDIHRDMAMRCYDLDVDNVSKPVRGTAKTYMVFPELYGSWFKNCARNLWERISIEDLKTAEGVGLYEHLRSRGIGNLDAFTNHIEGVERWMNQLFSHWSNEKDRWWKQYTDRGWFQLMTGFVCSGIYSYNNLMNAPIQGPSFHMLLWSLIRINNELKRRKMRSMIIGQIHDSIIGDVYEPELDDYLHLVNRVMTKDVRRHWDWIVTPLEVEFEMSATNWFEMSPRSLVL